MLSTKLIIYILNCVSKTLIQDFFRKVLGNILIKWRVKYIKYLKNFLKNLTLHKIKFIQKKKISNKLCVPMMEDGYFI
jgi:hypothetical protein